MSLSPLSNGFMFGANLWNGGQFVSQVYSTDLVAFEDFSLSDNTNVICTDLLDSGPTREILGGNVPRADGQYITADYFRERTIEVRGIVKASTAALLDAYLDTMKKSLRAREGNLDITRNSVVRRYVATMTNFDGFDAERKGYHVTFCPFVARFTCKTPYGQDRSYTSMTVNLTASPTNQTIDNTGTIRTLPAFILIFTAASSVTVVNVKRIDVNSVTLDEIEYSGSIAANDILTFDSENSVVKKNGDQVAYTGSFPTLEVGSNIFTFTVTGTSFAADTTLRHKCRYL